MKNAIAAFAALVACATIADPSLYDLELAEDIRLDALADKAWEDAKTPAEVAALKERILSAAREAIGEFPERTPLETKTVGEERFDGYRVEKLIFASRPFHHVTAHLYLPDSPKYAAPYPAILMPCGHHWEGKSEPVHARTAVVAAKAGFAALLCDPVDEGERRQRDGVDNDNVFGHRQAGLRAHLLGEALAQYRIWDGIRALDMLCERPDIDSGRIGASGFSGGGTMTAYMNIFDERIKCAAPMAFITGMTELAKGPGPQDSEQIFFGQLKFGLNHLAFLLLGSPKPILPAFTYDDFFPYAGSERTYALAKAWCERQGIADRIDSLECAGKHGWYESERFGMVKWMERWLNANTSALPLDKEALNALNASQDDPSLDIGLGLKTDPRALCAGGSVLRLPGEQTIFDILAEKAAAIEANRGALTPDIVRKVAGIWENIPGANRPETVHCEFEESDSGTVVMSATDAVAYERGVKDFWYSLKGPGEELAAMMMWRGENLIARKADEILWAAQQYYYGHAKTPVFMKADGAAVIAAAHAYYLCPEYFTGIEISNPPPSWKEAFLDPYLEIGAADVVYGAYRYYDWTDLLDASKWIVPVAPPSENRDTAVFRCEFKPDEIVENAEWTVTSMGVCRLFVNGKEVGADEWLKPGLTHVDKRRLSYTFDITGFLVNDVKGVNVLEAEVSASWWRDQVCNAPIYARRDSSGFKGNLAYRVRGGRTRYFTTGEGWRADYTGPVRKASIFDGEEYDATAEKSVESPAKVANEFKGVIVPHDGSSVHLREDLALDAVKAWVWSGVEGAGEEAYGKAKIVREYGPGEKMEIKKGETLVVDFGQNCAGVPEFAFSAKRGVRLSAASAEMLNDANGEKSRGNDGPAGSVYRANYRLSKSEIGYTFAGGDKETYMPHHTFFGGRYWSVSANGKVSIEKMRFVPLTSLAKQSETLEFSTGREDLNRLVQNSIWGMRSNYLSVPTDCPQRDERQGWTGDTQAYIGAAVWNADVRGFHRKWMADMRDSQMGDGEQYPGSYREVAPPGPAGVGGHRIGWSDAGVIVPYEVFKHYGDRRIIAENWESMKKFVALIRETGYHTYPNDYQSADWLSSEKYEQRRWFERKQPADEKESEKRLYWDLLGAAYRIRDLGMMAEMGEAIGKSESAAAYLAEREEAVRDFRSRFLGADGVLIDIFRDMQTPNLFVLALGLSPDEKAEAANKANLLESIRANGCRIKTGFLGTSILLDTLSAIGESATAYDVLLNEDFPGWLYSVAQGATTIWERWNSYTTKDGFGPVGMNSFNHYAYGAVEGWMVRNIAGIRPGEKGGFSEFTLAPVPDRRVGSARAVYHSLYGDIVSEWKYGEDGKCKWRFTIPVGSSATVRTPDGTEKKYISGSYELEI